MRQKHRRVCVCVCVCGPVVENIHGLLNQLHCVPKSIPPGTEQMRQKHRRVGLCGVCCRKHARSARSIASCPVVPQHQFYQAPIKSGKNISAWGAACGSLVGNMQGLLNQLHCLKSIPPSTEQMRQKHRRGVGVCGPAVENTTRSAQSIALCPRIRQNTFGMAPPPAGRRRVQPSGNNDRTPKGLALS